MNEQDHKFEAMLEMWQVPPLDGDLTGRILARARVEDKHLDALLVTAGRQSAELDRDLTGQVLAAARAEDAALDALLDTAGDVPAPGQDLGDTILRRVRREKLLGRLRTWLVPAAAAAAILIAAMVWFGPGGPSDTPLTPPVAVNVEQPDSQPPNSRNVGPHDQFAVNNYELIRDLPVFMHWETIRAMEQIERSSEESHRL